MRIGELAERSGVNATTIRYYEQIGLLPEPNRTPASYREYDEITVARLVFIRAAQQIGLSLAEIREVLALREQGQAPCPHVTTLLEQRAAEFAERIAALEQMRMESSWPERLDACRVRARLSFATSSKRPAARDRLAWLRDAPLPISRSALTAAGELEANSPWGSGEAAPEIGDELGPGIRQRSDGLALNPFPDDVRVEPHQLAAELDERDRPVQLPFADRLGRHPEEACDVIDRPQLSVLPLERRRHHRLLRRRCRHDRERRESLADTVERSGCLAAR